MLKNKKFAGYAIAFLILGILFNFMYSGLQNDQINIIQSFSAWSATATQMPITVGNFVCIVLTFVYGTCFIRFGVRKTLIPCMIVCCLGCLGIAAAGGLAVTSGIDVQGATSTAEVGNYTLYFISLFLVRCGCMCFQMSSMQLAASWFIRYRGTVLGIVTLGSPLFSVVGTSVMTSLIQTQMGADYRPFYVGIAVILVLMAICVGLFLRDNPEDVGLFPDGSATKPKSEASDEVNLTVGQILKQGKSWIIFCNFGAYQFVINCCMASMATWFITLYATNAEVVAAGALGASVEALGATTLWVGQAVKWLSVGAILGIPMSFLFGVIDDNLGTPIACVILGITCIIPPAALAAQAGVVASTGACSVPLLVLWGFGVACMTGGVPTMHPASMSYAFGRREYQSANRIIMALQLIPSAFAASLMVALISAGHGVGAYIMVVCVAIFGILTTLPMFKWTDPNAADRIYGSKQ
ncbi:MAG: MFS transporter [Oscillospiraceae bacterium]|nr:MFS transporter [Oscillospiraceae bacterium]